MTKFKPTKLIYIASAYSSLRWFPLNKIIEYLRYIAVTKCIGYLHDKYPYAFIGPITQSHNTAYYTNSKTGGFEHWEKIDLTFISKCDELWLYMNPGWETSKGVRAEILFCLDHKIPIRLIDPKTYKVKKMTKYSIHIDPDEKTLKIGLS